MLAVGLTLARAFDGVAVEAMRRTWIPESSGLMVRYEARYGDPLDAESKGGNRVRGRLEILRPKSKPADAAGVVHCALES
ncbi:MAG: hypothetical protein NTU45_06480 [Planctomycetota bacterium]|nr:hypothetical protein [Planctomycetota bacterium]